MTINERIGYVRREIAKVTQKVFAEALGLTQSGVSYLEQNGSSVSDTSVRLICNIYHVSYDWLAFGTGPIEPEEVFDLNSFLSRNHATETEIKILKAYFSMPPELRHSVIEEFKKSLAATDYRSGVLPESDAEADVEKAEALYEQSYKKTRSCSALKQELSASNITDGNVVKTG